MSTQHPSLAAGRWYTLGLLEQMAHVGGEVERAMMWGERNNREYSLRAAERALELLDLCLDDPKNLPRAKELTRVREVLVDSFFGLNEFGSTFPLWRSYFGAFSMAARRDC